MPCRAGRTSEQQRSAQVIPETGTMKSPDNPASTTAIRPPTATIPLASSPNHHSILIAEV